MWYQNALSAQNSDSDTIVTIEIPLNSSIDAIGELLLSNDLIKDKFVSITKNDLLNELLNSHAEELINALEKNKDKIDETYVQRLYKCFNMLNDNETIFTDNENNRTYPNYRTYKKTLLKLIIYNLSNKIIR